MNYHTCDKVYPGKQKLKPTEKSSLHDAIAVTPSVESG
jgi:hypothetical protein